jgi:hypothetical protein
MTGELPAFEQQNAVARARCSDRGSRSGRTPSNHYEIAVRNISGEC